MYVIFNQDGSIRETQLSKYVNQHSKGVDFVDVAIDGRTNEEYTCDANFALPNDANVTEVAQVRPIIQTSSGTYSGYRIGFNEAETEYEGDLSCSIRVYNKDGSVLWTFPFSIVVNKTTGYGDNNITNDQYESLMQALSNYQLMFAKSNMRSYDTKDEALKDLSNLADGQLIMAKENASSPTTAVYIKKDGALEMVSLDALSLDKYLKKEVIDGTWDGDDFTLSKTPTSFPFMARLTMAGTNNIAEVYFSDAFSSSEENIKIGLYNDAQSMYVFLYYPEDTSKNAVIQHPYIQGTNVADKVLVSKADKSAKWQFLKTINSQSLLGEGNIDIGGNEATALTNEDLNDLTTDGASYYAGGSNTVTNKPTGIDAFGLVIRRTASGYYAQYLTGANQSVNSIYVRTYKSGTWTAWERIIVTEGGTSVSIDELHTKAMSVGAIEFEPATLDGDFIQTLQAKTGTIALLDDLDACQKKTYLHTITAIGATFSISFTYPSANNLVVDSAQDASTVIKPTANEYFPAPVVVIATNKLSDACNCVYYNGTIWKFAMWNGTEFTNAEVVTAWQDSVVAVD